VSVTLCAKPVEAANVNLMVQERDELSGWRKNLKSPLSDGRSVIKNTASQLINLSNWKLRDLADKTWTLAALGTLTPNGHETITRSGQPNGGDTIDLINSDGRVVHTVTYGAAEEGETVIPQPRASQIITPPRRAASGEPDQDNHMAPEASSAIWCDGIDFKSSTASSDSPPTK